MMFVTTTEQPALSGQTFVDRFPIELEETLSKSVTLQIPLKTRRNGTLYIHSLLTKQNHKDDWTSAARDHFTTYAGAPISIYQVPVLQAFSLIGDTEKVVYLIEIIIISKYHLNLVQP